MNNKKMKEKVYNINNYNFYRRQAKSEDLDRAFIKLIEEGENKIKTDDEISNEKNKQINIQNKNNIHNVTNEPNEISKENENKIKKGKDISLDLIYPKLSMERIMKIRDLFLEFDEHKNRSFNKDDILVIFHMNKIPITIDEVIDLFGFNKRKKYIKFNDFIQLTVNEDFSLKFKKLIMERIRYRIKKSDICPNEFSDMLSHLCEFRKLSPDLKDKMTEEQKDNILNLSKEGKNCSQNIDNIIERNIYKRVTSRENSILGDILKGSDDKIVNIKNIDFTNEKDIIKMREQLNIIKKEKEFKNFIEVSNKKFLRYKNFLLKKNLDDNILQRKERLTKSLKTLNDTNSNLRRNYICYYPKENNLKNLENNELISLCFKKNRSKYPPIKYNNTDKNLLIEKKKTKRNIFLNNYYNKQNLMKLVKNKKIKKNSKEKKIKEQNEKDYASILEHLNDLHLPLIGTFSKNNKFKSFSNKYSESTFVTTGLYSNLNKL